MTMSTFLGGSSPSPGGGSSGNLYQNYNSGGQYSVSMSIRHEIQRFESVHPSIYAIYDLIELIPDQLLSQQIREHVVCIEGKTAKTTQCENSRILLPQLKFFVKSILWLSAPKNCIVKDWFDVKSGWQKISEMLTVWWWTSISFSLVVASKKLSLKNGVISFLTTCFFAFLWDEDDNFNFPLEKLEFLSENVFFWQDFQSLLWFSFVKTFTLKSFACCIKFSL